MEVFYPYSSMLNERETGEGEKDGFLKFRKITNISKRNKWKSGFVGSQKFNTKAFHTGRVNFVQRDLIEYLVADGAGFLDIATWSYGCSSFQLFSAF